MKWISWLTSFHMMKERLLFKLEGAFDANAVDQQSGTIIILQNILFIVGIN